MDPPTPQASFGELEAHEVAEVVFAAVFSPGTPTGADEVLQKTIQVLGGKSYHPYLSLSGVRASVMTPPRVNIMGRELLAFGAPMVNAVRTATPMLAGTCPKFRRTVTIEALAGTGGITQDYRARLWGYRYEAADLPRVVGWGGGPFEVRDLQRNRALVVDYPVIDVSEETWAQFPGGWVRRCPRSTRCCATPTTPWPPPPTPRTSSATRPAGWMTSA